MKRTFIMVAAILLSFMMADARTVKKNYEIDGFTGLSISDAFSVTIEKSKDFSVEIEVTDEFLPYVSVRNRGGVLEISFDKLPFKLKQKNRNKVALAVIRMPELTMLMLKGASSASCRGTFSDPMNKFTLDLAGASSVSGLDLRTPDVYVTLAGASRAEVNLSAGDVDAVAGGASKLEFTGKASSLQVKLSGASRLDADEFEVEEADVKAAGASNVTVRATEELKVDLSGASRCVYYGDYQGLNVRVEKVAGASTLKRKD